MPRVCALTWGGCVGTGRAIFEGRRTGTWAAARELMSRGGGRSSRETRREGGGGR